MEENSGAPMQHLSGGLADERDYPLVEQPKGEAAFGENHAFWISDAGVHINLHLNTLDGAGAYDLRHGRVGVLLANGRRLFHDEDGGKTVRSCATSGNLSFRCESPFKRWVCSYRGMMRDTSFESPRLSPPNIVVDIEVACEMAAPPWINGSFNAVGLESVAAFLGGHRYEQLIRCKGRIRIGEQEIVVDGYGNRTHRQGVRIIGPMIGHCWGAGFFPSGKGFGYQSYPTLDGGLLWDEGYVIADGRLIAAHIANPPWLESFHPAGEIIATELEFDNQKMTIHGESLGSSMMLMIPASSPEDDIILSQAWMKYEYEGEISYNMLERSLRRGEIMK
jgi:hypothetical protein